jgi:serine/threonine protein kinase/tetratricopeptide (TPR) repeat protein
MKSDEPGRAQGKDLSSAGGGIAIRSSSSGVPLPDSSESPIANGASDLVPSQPSSLDADSPTLVDATVGPVGAIAGEAAAGGRVYHPQADPTHSGLAPGTVIAQRYQILDVLGEGGMGAVYKAKDRELNRMVALKVIRPELARNPAIVERFKQELRLSHQVTHKNVIRIYDLGEGEGVKFITMEYIEGKDLRSLIREKKRFTPEETVEVIQQVCQALDAAHSVGVIHRDLKPQNIMQDRAGRILVMDFGLARTLQGDGMTQTGALVGTMEYMSPEQALGKELDQRSDIFSLGLIGYELLTGKMPFVAESALASLIKRTQERAIPVSDVDDQIPGTLSGIVSKCLERDLSDRYQSVSGVLADLNTWKDKRAAGTIKFNASVKPWGQTLPWPLIAGIVTALALAISGYMLRDRLFKSSPSTGPAIVAPAVSLAILPFRNASGDQSLDWLGPSLAEMLSTDVGQSAHLRTVSSDRVHQILNDLHMIGNVQFDPATLRQISESGNADMVISGQYVRFGDQIRIDASLQDLKHDRRIPLKNEAAGEKDIPSAVDRLAESIRQNLSVSPDVIKELQAQAFRPSSNSLESLRSYNDGLGLVRQGNNLEALKRFQSAVKADPEFALAYAKLGQTYSALGYDNEAEQASRRAVDLSSNLPSRERYLIVANHARVINDNQKAIGYYEDMAKVSPEDTDVQFALGGLYENIGAYDKAREHFDGVLQRDPQYIDALMARGRVEIRSSNPSKGLEYLNRAYSLAAQLDNQEEVAASLHLMGVAYEALSKPEEALGNFEKSLAIKRRIGQQRGAAASLNEIGNIQARLGKAKAASASFQEALKIRRDIGDKRGLGSTLLDFGNFVDDRGDHDQALRLYTESLQIQRDIGNESLQAICLNNIGSVHFSKGEYADALTYFQQALQLREKSKISRDIVESVHNVAETSAMMGQYDQAVTQYMRALELRRGANDPRGAAIESYSIGTLFDYQGRFGAAINSKQDALKTFRDLKDRTFWMAEILGGYGNALILAGRGDEAKSYLDESLSLAGELKNYGLVAQTLGWQGDAFYYRGDVKSAKSYYERALQAATRTSERDKVLLAKVDLAKVSVQEGHAGAALNSLRSLAQQAQELGLKYIAIECSLHMAEAMTQAKDYSHARQELDRALSQSDKLGLKPLTVKAHYLLATTLRQSGNNAEAQDHYRQALRLLDALRKEPGAEKLMQRSDVSTMFSDSTRSLQTKN